MNTNFDFIQEFYQKVDQLKIDWNIKGLVAEDQRVYALGSDSKILGRVFEILTAPIIKEIAEEHGLIMASPESQNTYPDFILMSDERSRDKIAIDIKTTYREGRRALKFTLGSFTSYMRDNTKNIQYSYDQYSEHYVIGFAYVRNKDAEEGHITTVGNLHTLDHPYTGVDFFVRKKIDITGQKKGSGNTDNIASISGPSIEHFKTATGPFSVLPRELYHHYWKNYPKNTDRVKSYLDLQSYFNKLEEDPNPTSEISRLLSYKSIYENWKLSQIQSL